MLQERDYINWVRSRKIRLNLGPMAEEPSSPIKKQKIEIVHLNLKRWCYFLIPWRHPYLFSTKSICEHELWNFWHFDYKINIFIYNKMTKAWNISLRLYEDICMDSEVRVGQSCPAPISVSYYIKSNFLCNTQKVLCNTPDVYLRADFN